MKSDTESYRSTLYKACPGFSDDGNHPALEALDNYARPLYCEGLYFGDNGQVYLIA